MTTDKGYLTDMQIKKSAFDVGLTKFNLFVILLFTAILSPEISPVSGFPSFKLHELIIYLFFPILLLIGYFHFNNLYRVKTILTFLSLLIFSFVVSITYSYFILQIDYGYRDFFEFVKIFKLMLIIILASEVNFDEEKITAVIYVTALIFFFVFIFAILQFYNLFNISQTLGIYYSPEYHLSSAMGLGRRVTSVAGGPNSLGALCSFGNLFFLSVFFHDNKKKMRRIMIILSGYLMTLITVFLTSSRTSSVALLFITFIFLFFTNIKIRYKIIFSLIIIGIFISLLPHLIHLNQITEGAGITKHGSYIERIRMWKDTFVDIERSPIFGNGIAKDSMRTWVDNSYVLMLRRIGIFGMIFWILFYLCPLFSVDKKHRDMSWFAFMLIMFALLFSMTANHFTEIKLIDTYVMFIGMALSILNGEKKHAPKSA